MLLELRLVRRSQAAPPGAGVERADETLARPIDLGEASGRRGAALLAAEALDVALELTEPRERDAPAEPRSRCVLEAVRLVEDDGVVVGKDRGAIGAGPITPPAKRTSSTG